MTLTLTSAQIDAVVTMALAEDAPWGDITGDTLLPEDARAEAVLVARESGVFAGGEVIVRTMALAHAGIRVDLLVADGQTFAAGDTLARISGLARPLLRAERVALNLAQRMSGIATATRLYVDAVAHTKARIVDTRKTTPGLRALERHAVRCGGANNHRFSLSDAVLAKDNHLAVLTAGGADLSTVLREARNRLPHTVHLEVEVDRIGQIASVLDAGVDTIMLDNFSLAELREGVALIGGRALVEASGGVTLDSVRAIAETGVDVISVGALTHSVRALDLGLDIAVLADASGTGAA